jgi:hypothetical protein
MSIAHGSFDVRVAHQFLDGHGIGVSGDQASARLKICFSRAISRFAVAERRLSSAGACRAFLSLYAAAGKVHLMSRSEVLDVIG